MHTNKGICEHQAGVQSTSVLRALSTETRALGVLFGGTKFIQKQGELGGNMVD